MGLDYVKNRWTKYLVSGNPENLRRLASHQNWLTPEEEQMNVAEFSRDRISELEAKARVLVKDGRTMVLCSPQQLEALQELVSGTLDSLATDGEADPETENYQFWEQLLEKLK